MCSTGCLTFAGANNFWISELPREAAVISAGLANRRRLNFVIAEAGDIASRHEAFGVPHKIVIGYASVFQLAYTGRGTNIAEYLLPKGSGSPSLHTCVSIIGGSGALGLGLALRLAQENSRTTESLTALLIGFNARYKTHAGICVTGLDDR